VQAACGEVGVKLDGSFADRWVTSESCATNASGNMAEGTVLVVSGPNTTLQFVVTNGTGGSNIKFTRNPVLILTKLQ
jgi:hypothetical protein